LRLFQRSLAAQLCAATGRPNPDVSLRAAQNHLDDIGAVPAFLKGKTSAG
jgi:hypothetical protein